MAADAAPLDEFRRRIWSFVDDRGFRDLHTPRNLVVALAAEVGELLRHFIWKSDDEIRAILQAGPPRELSDEIADVFIYLIQLADTLGIELESAASDKIVRNADKYPGPRV